jgi:acyl-CoA synthetase (AMP-forming)/AMP-acid ligase II
VTVRTAVELMKSTVDAHGDREAFVDGDRRLTFAEWDRASGGVASVLAERGVRKGDVVCLRLPSSIEYAVCYQAALRLGAITSGINTRLGPTEVKGIVAQAAARGHHRGR